MKVYVFVSFCSTVCMKLQLIVDLQRSSKEGRRQAGGLREGGVCTEATYHWYWYWYWGHLSLVVVLGSLNIGSGTGATYHW